MSEDYFRDVRGDLRRAGYGSLAGDGIERHYKASVERSEDNKGITIMATCDHCGRDNAIDMNWQELIICGNGLVPANWKWDSGYLKPYLGCPNCQRELEIGVTPDECKRHVFAAVQARVLDENWVRQVSAQLLQQAAAQQQQRPGMVRR